MPIPLEVYKDRAYAIKAVREGLPVEVYTALRAEINISDKALSKRLGISERTILRRKSEGRYKPYES